MKVEDVPLKEHPIALSSSTVRVTLLQLEAPIPHDKIEVERSGRKRFEWANGAGEPRLERAIALVDSLVAEPSPPHIVLFPEYTIPLWQDAINQLQAASDRTGMILVCGADNATPESIVGDRVYTKSAVISPGVAPVFVEKRKVSPKEQEYGRVDEPEAPSLHVFTWKGPNGRPYWFTVQVCFDYLDFALAFHRLVPKHEGSTFSTAPGMVLATLCSHEVTEFQNKAENILRDDERRIPSVICNTVGDKMRGGSRVVVNNLEGEHVPVLLPTTEEEAYTIALELDGIVLNRPYSGRTKVPIRLATRRLLDGDRTTPPDGIRILEWPAPATLSEALVKDFYMGRVGASLPVAVQDCHERPCLGKILDLVPQASSGFRVVVIQGESGTGKSLLLHQTAARVLRRPDTPIVIELLSTAKPDVWSYLEKLAQSRHVVVLAEDPFEDRDMVNAIAEVSEGARITLVATTRLRPPRIGVNSVVAQLQPPDPDEKRALAEAIRTSLDSKEWTKDQERLIEAPPKASIQTATWILARGKIDWILDDFEDLMDEDPHLALGCGYVYFAHAHGIETPRTVLGRLDDHGRYTLLTTLEPTRHLVVEGERADCVSAQHLRIAKIGSAYYAKRGHDSEWMFERFIATADPTNVTHRRFVASLTRALLSDGRGRFRATMMSPTFDSFWSRAETFTDVYFWRHIWEASGNAPRVAETDARLLELGPASSWECMMKMNLRRAQGDIDGAVAVARGWLAREPDDGHVWSITAHLLAKEGSGRQEGQKWAFNGILGLVKAGKAGTFELGAFTSIARALGGKAAEEATAVLGFANLSTGAAPPPTLHTAAAIWSRLREGDANVEEATAYALVSRLAPDPVRQEAAKLLVDVKDRFDSPSYRRALAVLLVDVPQAAEARNALALDLISRLKSDEATRGDAEALGIVASTSQPEIVQAASDALAEEAQDLPVGLLAGLLRLIKAPSTRKKAREKICTAILARISDPDVTANDIEALLSLAELCSPETIRAVLGTVSVWIASHDHADAARQKWVSFVEAHGDSTFKKATRHDTYAWLEKHPRSAGVWVAYLSELHRAGFKKQANRRARKASALNPDNPALQGFLRTAHVAAGVADVAALKRDVEVNPRNPHAKRSLAKALSARSDSATVGPTDADPLYRDLLFGPRPVPKNNRSNTWYRVLCDYVDHLRFSRRAVEAEKLVAIIPPHLPPTLQVRLLNRRAQIRWHLATLSRAEIHVQVLSVKAERDFRAAVALATESAGETTGLLGDLGRFLISRGQPREAAVEFRNAVDAFREASEAGEPDDPVSLACLAIALAQSGTTEELNEARVVKIAALGAFKAADEPIYGWIRDALDEIP